MTTSHETIEAGGAAPPAEVKVWDPVVRLFHWSLVALFALAFATGDEIARLHIAAGYAIAALLAVRLVWGLVGPRHARFGNFVRGPRETLSYLRDMARNAASRHLGHNPAGGAMIVALLTVLAATCATGYMMTTDAYWGAKWVEHIHEAFANLAVGLVAFHVGGIVVASFAHRENLVKAMITGRKRSR